MMQSRQMKRTIGDDLRFDKEDTDNADNSPTPASQLDGRWGLISDTYNSDCSLAESDFFNTGQASPLMGGSSSFQQLNRQLPPLDLSNIQYPKYTPSFDLFGKQRPIRPRVRGAQLRISILRAKRFLCPWRTADYTPWASSTPNTPRDGTPDVNNLDSSMIGPDSTTKPPWLALD
ncbi:hypothetical protein F5Y14DRAFT_462013 [Nemania sp. NC0429]|nr:hypothetical protein F5Y14DRAFT_462013 [Nemania sp. NC0429]